MSAPLPPARFTRAMFDALPDDGRRHEIIDGEHHVTPSPGRRHQLVVVELLAALHAWLRANPVGQVIVAPWDLDLADDTIVQPDIVVLPRSAGDGTPLLVIEVLSASTASRDRIVKRPRYQRAGIAEYWIVDAESRLVERWRPEDERPEIITATLRWHPVRATAALEIALAPIFDLVSSADDER
ncbi:MAG: Uma2 family endonuclease [Gemmatimonadaceae bacterium]|nr:Uma2 family endonuclease [Gemmatimonadaceae bacterium]NUQ94822.1 Uma2 family endonuclease [Gemmatimonadaceae bacterium]NUR19671.1 Uma2 family endonuclease [Gemmatimonadaceae bacterium]NUS98154.1 Uma2 family endonuclease [Gemmatimonadaceae bacterium]